MNSIKSDFLNSEKELEKEFETIINKPINCIKLSNEQEKIINSSQNMIVDAVAGSGKTTTILYISSNNPTKKVFQITYNNLLKIEVRTKAKSFHINNLEIHTYHSLAVKYYDPKAYTDEEIKKILILNKQVEQKQFIEQIDILIIDEAQDMTDDYYKLINKFIYDTNSNPQIIILGDKYQGIYEFKNSNIKFITLANKIWKREFINCNLTTSYRLTNQIAWFINNIMLGYNRINTIKDGFAVDYYIANPFTIYKKIGKYLINLIKLNKIVPSDIFILIPSIKTIDAPYKKLENYLVKNGIKCITPISDDAKLDNKVISNKVVFTTYHQAKGRERKIVILYNFDNSYMEYYSNITYNICPNILYVGVTRASEKLILIQDANSKPLKFLNHMKLIQNNYLNIIQTDIPQITNHPSINLSVKIKKIKKINVTEMIKFIGSKRLDVIIELLNNNLINEFRQQNVCMIPIPNKIKIINKKEKNIMYEDVSELNGLIIPAMYEAKINNSMSSIENYVQNNLIKSKHKYKINIPCKTIKDFLKIGNIYTALQNKLHAKLVQIKKYDWLNKKMILECHKNMDMIDSNSLFEIVIKSESKIDQMCDCMDYEHEIYGHIQISGRLDVITSDSVYELKCVDNITIEHKLQLIVYYWMWIKTNMSSKYGIKKFFLLNIKSGQCFQLITTDFHLIEQIVQILFDEKYLEKKELNDTEFINMCLNT